MPPRMRIVPGCAAVPHPARLHRTGHSDTLASARGALPGRGVAVPWRSRPAA
jgi:hypothetical protein